MTRSTKVVSKPTTDTKHVDAKVVDVTLKDAQDAKRGIDEGAGTHVVTLAAWYNAQVAGKAGKRISSRAAAVRLTGRDGAKSQLSNVDNAVTVARLAFPALTHGETYENIVGIMYAAINDNGPKHLTTALHSFIVEYVASDSTKSTRIEKARAAVAAVPVKVKAKAPKPPTVDHSPKDGDSTETADDKGSPLAQNRETKQVVTIADHIGIVTQWLNSEKTSQGELALNGSILESLALALSAREVVA